MVYCEHSEEGPCNECDSPEVKRCNYQHSLTGFCMKCGWSHQAIDPDTVRHLEIQRDGLQARCTELVEQRRAVELTLKQTEESRQMWMAKCQEKSDDKADAIQALQSAEAEVIRLRKSILAHAQDWVTAANIRKQDGYSDALRKCASILKALG
jgi:hypothetical protein